jgi:sodium transport system permease protein
MTSRSKPRFLIILQKELRETLREKRTVGLLVLFTLMYPVMFGVLMQQLIDRATRSDREGIELAVIGSARAPTLMAQLKQKNINVVDTAPLDEAAIQSLLQKGKVAGVLRLSDKFVDNYTAMRPARIELWYDSAAEKNSQRREVEDVLNAYSTNVASARLLAHGVSPATLRPVDVQRYDTGTNASRSAGLIGGMLSMLFFPAFFCGMSAAVDSTAGERERRSMEVLMAQPAHPWEIVTGKWLMAATLAVAGLTLELLLAHGVLSWLPLEELGMTWSLNGVDVAMVCLVAVPLALLAAALQIALAMNAKSFKEAQSTLSLVLLLPMVPGVVVSMMDLKTSLWMYAVPMLSNQTLLREMSKGVEVGALPFLLTFISAALPALAIVAFASWRMKSERYVLAV